MHSFYSPANALYEIIVGATCLAIWFGAVFSIPALVALLLDSKEEAEREPPQSCAARHLRPS